MNTSDIIIVVGFILFMALITILYSQFMKKYKILKEREILESKNKPIQFSPELQRIYATIDTKAVDAEIDNWIAGYLSDYIAKNITIQGSEYIKQADIDKMLKEILTSLITNMSDLYRWYISLMINIDNEDRLIDFINNKLSLQIISFVSKFNQTK